MEAIKDRFLQSLRVQFLWLYETTFFMPASNLFREFGFILSASGNCSVGTKYLNAAFKYPLTDGGFADADGGLI
jgi:hypothetical protein